MCLVNSTATQREDNLVCTFRFTYQNAIDWIIKNKKIPIQFDIEILHELASLNGQIIRYAPKLSKQFSLILGTVSQNGMNLKYADYQLKNNPRIVTAALRQNHKAYQFMGDQMWDNRKVMNLVVKTMEFYFLIQE